MSWDATSPATTDYLNATFSGVPKTHGFTIAYWFRQQPNTDLLTIWMLGDPATAGDHCGARYRSTGTKMQAMGWDGSSVPNLEAAVSGTLLDVWHLWIWGWDTSTARWMIQNGGSKTSSTQPYTFVDPAANGTITLGTEPGETRLMDGYLAEFCIWDTLLSDAQAASLYVSSETGVYPNQVATGNVVGYWPLVSNATATVGTNLTENGTITYASGTHPTMQNLPVANDNGAAQLLAI